MRRVALIPGGARGMVVGTADYIAPEQARGEGLDERADVYSLGCTLFHLLTGHPPYRAPPGPSVKEYLEVMRMHLTAPVPDVRTEKPETDAELAEVIAAMMTKERNARPTFSEIARRLARITVRLDGQLPRVTRQLFLVSPAPAPGSSNGDEVKVPRVSIWPRVAALAAILALAVALALLAGR